MTTAGLAAHLVVRRGESFTLDARLEVPVGTTVALLGPNGAGKSTCVDALAGLVALDDGFITLGGTTLDDPTTGRFVPAHRRHVGVVFQGYHLFTNLNALDNVAFGLRQLGHSRGSARQHATSWLTRLGLADLAERRTRELSGGQAQRVALARTLASQPDLVLLDEPLAALDVEARASTRRFLTEHLATVTGPRILITHDPTDAFSMADRIDVIENGRIVQRGTPESIRRQPATPYVASLSGVNLFRGRAHGGVIDLDAHRQMIHTSNTTIDGDVLVTIPPTAVALYAERPQGSPRNVWSSTVAAIESRGGVVRVTMGDPLPVGVDITPGAVDALDLVPGSTVWVSVKATEVTARAR